MPLKFCSFASGSSGNCYMVASETTTILVDAGISAKRIIEGLKGTDTATDKVKAVLITHEHYDHVKGLRVLMKRLNHPPAYANEKTFNAMEEAIYCDKKILINAQTPFKIGDIEVKAFHTSHDAVEPFGYSFSYGGRKLSIVTDTGMVGDKIIKEILDADTLVLEANHEEELLLYGRYPYYLKQRILGERGHLSNKAAVKTMVSLSERKSKKRNYLFAHLSKENNFPESVYQSVREVFPEDDGFTVDILLRDKISCVYLV